MRRDHEMTWVGWNLSFRVLIPISFRGPLSPCPSCPAGHNTSSSVSYRVKNGRVTSLLGTSVSNWKMKGLNSLGWDTSLFSQAALSSPFSPSCRSVCVSLTLLGFGCMEFVCPAFPSRL